VKAGGIALPRGLSAMLGVALPADEPAQPATPTQRATTKRETRGLKAPMITVEV